MVKRQDSIIDKKSTSKSRVEEKNRIVNVHGSRANETKPVISKQTSQNPQQVKLTQDQIRERAKLIWQQRGCRSGEDERNWLEAENQLKKELSVV